MIIDGWCPFDARTRGPTRVPRMKLQDRKDARSEGRFAYLLGAGEELEGPHLTAAVQSYLIERATTMALYLEHLHGVLYGQKSANPFLCGSA